MRRRADQGATGRVLWSKRAQTWFPPEMRASRKRFANVSPGRRRIMSAIRSTGSRPETSIRQALHRLGYRFRKNVRTLPGKPDIVFSARKKIIFVHGCFWHQHAGCSNAGVPQTRTDYWHPKLARNVENDKRHVQLLEEQGWSVSIVWECDVRKSLTDTVANLVQFLGPTRSCHRS